MRSRIHVILLLALLASVFLNLLVHGGLARLPEGKVFVESAKRESPVALAYMTLGEWLVSIPGLAAIGEQLAQAVYGPAFAAVKQSPSAASDIIELGDFGRAHALARANYWATPLLFVAWLIAFLLRPREVHLTQRRR